MALELSIVRNAAGETLYAIIRRASDGYVWNGTTFLAWSDGSIATYDVPLTSQGGDLYAANFPSSISASTYRIAYYKQAGGTPAISDIFLDTKEIYWNGSTVTGSPSSDYLTTLAKVKEYQNTSDSTQDALRTTCLSAASRFIEHYCGRLFLTETRSEKFNGSGDRYIELYAYPVTAVTRVAANPQTAITVRNGGATVSRATVTVTATALVLRHTISASETTNTLTLSSYTTITALVAAINAVGAGWTAAVQGDLGNYNPADLGLQAALDAKECEAEVELYTEDIQRSRIDYDNGIVYVHRGFPFGYQNILVNYTGGYDPGAVPDEVQLACASLTAAMFGRSTRDSGLKGERIGDYSYENMQNTTANDASLRDLSMEAYILLQPYRRIPAL